MSTDIRDATVSLLEHGDTDSKEDESEQPAIPGPSSTPCERERLNTMGYEFLSCYFSYAAFVWKSLKLLGRASACALSPATFNRFSRRGTNDGKVELLGLRLQSLL